MVISAGVRIYLVVKEPLAKAVECDAAPFAHAEIDGLALLAVWWCGSKHVFVVDGERVDISYWLGDGGWYGIEGGKGIEVYLVV